MRKEKIKGGEKMLYSFSYKQGFKKGIEIYSKNLSLGYDADRYNEKTMKTCKTYANSGYKEDVKLTDNQIDCYQGMSDGIQYKYQQLGIKYDRHEQSTFEKHEYKHYYED